MSEPPQPPESWPTLGGEQGPTARRRQVAAGSGVMCTACGSEQLEDGFLEDTGEASRGYIRWVIGPLERGLFGGAKRFGRARLVVTGKRCPRCGHLELFATEPA